jgi:hypothetical protein
MTALKLIAMEPDDLAVIAAHMQDAVGTVGDLAYLPRERRFVALFNRFDWLKVAAGGAGKSAPERRKSALRIERVTAAKVQGFDVKAKGQVLSLLTLTFTPGSEAPAGAISLIFAGGAAIRLEVECIEASLADIGAAWTARATPDHGGPDGER